MSIATVTIKSQMKKHVTLGTKNANLAAEIHQAALEDLNHASLHGDVTLCRHLYDALGGANSAARTATLKAWFVLFSGNQMTAEKGEWRLKKGWTPEKFDLVAASAAPYWTLAPEKSPENLSIDKLLGMIAGMAKKIDKAVEQDRFNGDPEKAKALVVSLADFAKTRANAMTMQERGTLTDTADKLLANG